MYSELIQFIIIFSVLLILLLVTGILVQIIGYIANIDYIGSKTNIGLFPIFLLLLVITFGDYIFIKPLSHNINDAIFYGAVIGLLVFGSVDLVALALVENPNPMITTISFIDIINGMILNALVAMIIYHILYSDNNKKFDK